MLRRLVTLLASFMLIPIGLVLTSDTAHADDPEQSPLTCTGTIDATYSPPLQVIPHETTVAIKEDYNCSHPVVTTGKSESTYTQTASCLLPSLEDTLPPSLTVIYQWSPGKNLHSTVEYTTTVVTHPLGQTVVTATGTVIDGYKKGSAALVTVVRPNINLVDCLTHGVDHDNRGTVILAIG